MPLPRHERMIVAASKSSTTRKKVIRKKSPEIHAYVPDKAVAKRYVGRKIHGVWDLDLAQIAIEEQKNILLMGDTGAGKTLFGEAFASFRSMMYYSLACDVSIDPSSLFGRMQPTEVAGEFRWQDGPVTQVVRNGGVLNISEINFMTPKIAASLYPLLDGRRYIPLLGHEGEVVRAHPNLLIIADMNPQYRGTMELNAAFKNRFDFKIDWGYENEVEKQLVKYPTLLKIAGELRAMMGSELVTPVSTNMLMEFEEFSTHDKLGLNFAVANFIAAFETDEKDPISKVFDLNRADLIRDQAHFASRGSTANVDDELEEVDWEVEMD